MLRRVWADIRFGSRTLRRTPSFTVVAAITLALGIGANTAIFSLVNGILLQPLPYDDAGRLVGVWNTAPGLDVDQVTQSPALHFTYVDEAQVFEDVGLWTTGTVAVTGLEEASQERALFMTEGILPALRVVPPIWVVCSTRSMPPKSP